MKKILSLQKLSMDKASGGVAHKSSASKHCNGGSRLSLLICK
jgi:Lanthionine-containing peptide SapB precursor RamS